MNQTLAAATMRLGKDLGYVFRNPALTERALNHRSARGVSNERLEFLGDAVLDTVISAELYRQFPDADEGVLSRLRASLARDASLAKLAAGLSLGKVVRLGSGELKSGGARRDSILADALEAMFGAIFLDGGYAAAEATILRVFAQRLSDLELTAAAKDNKTQLQELLQSRGVALPDYVLTGTTGAPHQRTFSVVCRVATLEYETSGEGSSRRLAEQCAAKVMLNKIQAGA